MFKLLIIPTIVSILAVASPAQAKSISTKEMCTVLVPSMMEFVGNFEDIPETFNELYSKLSASQQVELKDVKGAGEALGKMAVAYRKAWLEVCF